ncbi:MAG: MBOAT family protein [Lachnospiraceae bacterium]|nr:MBOAT family protein [Lachnospiraceae bacterium]
MNFNSFSFLFLFLPITLLIFWMLRKKAKDTLSLWFLSLASLFFYGISYPEGIVILIISLLVNYGLIRINTKGALVSGIIIDIAVLLVFKYGHFFYPQIGDSITAPGISFYTFCEVAVLMEMYRKNIGVLSPGEYSFLITFFPKMIQGPIVRPQDMMDSSKVVLKRPDIEAVYRGILLFSIGCFKKVIIADTLGSAVDYGFDNLLRMHTLESIVIMLSYTLQLYFDFSGYCDMGMAIAGFFGIELPLNFNSPYKARNINDFWKRWHMTLTNFFTRYLYIPLGGNRKGKVRMYINLLLIFLVSGLWHGAGFTFIVWGMMHGVLYVIHRMYSNKFPVKNGNRLKNAVSVLLTFLYVNAAWVFFRAPSLKEAFKLFDGIGEMWFPRFNIYLANTFNIDEFWYVIKVLHLDRFWWGSYILMVLILVILLLTVFFKKSAIEYSKNCKIGFLSTALIVVLLVWCILSFNGVATYLYVNF